MEFPVKWYFCKVYLFTCCLLQISQNIFKPLLLFIYNVHIEVFGFLIFRAFRIIKTKIFFVIFAFAKINPREIFLYLAFAKISPREIFENANRENLSARKLIFAKINLREN